MGPSMSRRVCRLAADSSFESVAASLGQPDPAPGETPGSKSKCKKCPKCKPCIPPVGTVGYLYDELGASLLKASAVDVEQRIGKPSPVDGHRWTYTTLRGTLAVYFDDAQVVIDVQPSAFDLSIFKK